MGPLMMKPQFKKMLGLWLDSIEAHARTGRLVGENGALGEPLRLAA